MDNDIKVWLFDILQSINEIESFFLGETQEFEIFRNDIKTKRAIERDIEIIGEAVGRILKKDQSIEISYARQIVATRNRIIHSYDSVSDDLIWSIVINHLPKLKDEVTLLLE